MQLSKTAPTILPVSYDELKANQEKRATGSTEMDQQAFLNLLVTQMQNQDPLNPMDNAEFTQQTTAFSQLEQLINLNTSIKTLVDAQTQNSQLDQTLVSSSNFIGRQIEYDTNTLKVTKGANMPISFYSAAAADKGTIRIYNSEDALVGVLDVEDGVKQGANAHMWNGMGIGGTVLEDGMYYFEVEAYGSDGNAIEIATYGQSTVLGVKINGGKMYFEVDKGLVPAESVYGVKQDTGA